MGNNNKYSLMKKIFLLERDKREYLHDHFDEIFNIVKEEPKKKENLKDKEDRDTKVKPENNDKIPDYYHTQDYHDVDYLPAKTENLRIVVADKLYDPETPAQMLKLLEQMEKYIVLDGNLSYENLCIFLQPLVHGAKKIILRPYRIVGFAKVLEKLSREYERKIGDGQPNKKSVRVNFSRILKRLRERLEGKEFEVKDFVHPAPEPKKIILKQKKVAQVKVEQNFSGDVLAENLTNLKRMGITRDEAIRQVQLIAPNLEIDLTNLEQIANEIFGENNVA